MPNIVIPALEDIMDKPFPVLNGAGFVKCVGYYGSDTTVVNAARVSYGAGTKTVNEDKGLIHYLMRNMHCYHPDMQVLTIRGWIKWSECRDEEGFIVPDPATRTMNVERLKLDVFSPGPQALVALENSRMSFAVTSNHRMWIKGKTQDFFHVRQAAQLPRWGSHLDPLNGYRLFVDQGPLDDLYMFIGFYLGDGSYGSTNTVSFHLKKTRKKEYLRELLDRLGWTYKEVPSSYHEDGTIFYVKADPVVWEIIKRGERSHDKCFPMEAIADLGGSAVRGLLDGLINSDGSIKRERPQIQFSSTSNNLLELFELLSAMLGVDAHRTTIGTTAFNGERTSLELRGHDFKEINYDGKTYCTTTSTGLLMVRGGIDKFAFVCGNSSPFEQCNITWHIKQTIFCERQMGRHRMMRRNEISGRYSVMKDEFYTPEESNMRKQSDRNKQVGEGRMEDADAKLAIDCIKDNNKGAYDEYQRLMSLGVAREQARMVLPQNLMTEGYWQCDWSNLMKFLGLRLDWHAQAEIREIAEVMNDHFMLAGPMSHYAFEEYLLYGDRLSRTEMDIVRKLKSRLDVEFGELTSHNIALRSFNDESKPTLEFEAKLAERAP